MSRRLDWLSNHRYAMLAAHLILDETSLSTPLVLGFITGTHVDLTQPDWLSFGLFAHLSLLFYNNHPGDPAVLWIRAGDVVGGISVHRSFLDVFEADSNLVGRTDPQTETRPRQTWRSVMAVLLQTISSARGSGCVLQMTGIEFNADSANYHYAAERRTTANSVIRTRRTLHNFRT
jgi:hypothetical protein